MTRSSSDRVVVAVGPGGSTAAVELAAAESARRGLPLHLVHVIEPVPGSDGGADDRSWREGAQLLAAAIIQADSLLGKSQPVTSALALNRPVTALAEASAGAAVLVVGRTPESRRTRRHVRSVTGDVAARVTAPVVSVPEGWEPTSARPTVVAGVDEPAHCRAGLDAAFAAARDRDAALVVISTRWRPSGVTDRPLTQVTDPTWRQRVEAELEDALITLREKYADVPVELRMCHARASETLIDASRDADLVIVGRHTCLVPAGSHLGPVARAVVRGAVCPVLLAAPEDHHQMHRTAVHAHALTTAG